jgi:hypothetical protein
MQNKVDLSDKGDDFGRIWGWIGFDLASGGNNLLALSIGQRLCVNFYVSITENFLTTLRSHLDVTCSYYFWSSFFNVDDESLHTLDK